jgi:hypothetical protein
MPATKQVPTSTDSTYTTLPTIKLLLKTFDTKLDILRRAAYAENAPVEKFDAYVDALKQHGYDPCVALLVNERNVVLRRELGDKTTTPPLAAHCLRNRCKKDKYYRWVAPQHASINC